MTSELNSGVYHTEQVVGLVLAGGAGRRMGGTDKGLIELDGRPLLQWVAEALCPQVASLLISANRHQERYAEFGWPVITDSPFGQSSSSSLSSNPYQGPLAGIATALVQIKTGTPCLTQFHQSRGESPSKQVKEPAWLLVSPCDTPLIPIDLGPRLATALRTQQARIAIAADQKRSQPLHALIPTDIGADLDDYLRSGGRSVFGWLDRHKVATTIFDQTPSPFRNLNQPADAEVMRAHIDRNRGRPGNRRPWINDQDISVS